MIVVVRMREAAKKSSQRAPNLHHRLVRINFFFDIGTPPAIVEDIGRAENRGGYGGFCSSTEWTSPGAVRRRR
ncbi:uncharacterized protein Dmul_30750 [Desulfococcus multivorans]|nr:uncharacterized protein Dmul_30750 [Desulfococcus multivorans]